MKLKFWPRGHRIASFRELAGQTFHFYKRNFRLILRVALVAEAVNIVIALVVADNDLVKALWFGLFVAPALVFVISGQDRRAKKPLSAPMVYHKASRFSLRFLGVLVMLSIFTIPLSLGAFIFNTATFFFVINWVEQAVVTLVLIVLALPTALLLARYSFAQIEVIRGQRTIEALRASRRLTDGRLWVIIARAIPFWLAAVLALALVIVATSLAGLSEPVALAVTEIALFFLVLPLAYVYLDRLYKGLN